LPFSPKTALLTFGFILIKATTSFPTLLTQTSSNCIGANIFLINFLQSSEYSIISTFFPNFSSAVLTFSPPFPIAAPTSPSFTIKATLSSFNTQSRIGTFALIF